MSHYKPYPTYKDSGVEWIGQVPEHWVVKRLRHVAALNPSPDWQALESQQSEYPFLPMEAISEVGELDSSRRKPLDECRSGYTYFADGDVAFAKVTPCYENGKGAVIRGLEGGHGFGTTELTVLRPTAINRDFLYLLTYADCFRQPGASEMLGSGGLKRVPDDFTRDYRAGIPPSTEQAAIAAALDCETARIDALIAKKTRFIELLREKRQALITHAVTKGLDPNVNMKDSGVEWIGEVPEHWEISKLAYTTREAGGKTPDTKNQAYWDGHVPWVSPKDMKQSEIVDAIDKISDAAVSDCGMKLFEPGTILAVVRGMILAHSFPVAELKVPATINQDMKALEPDKRIRPNYLRLILETAKDYVVSVLVAEAAHGTRVLRTDVWRQLPALLPPVEEQDQILAELDRVTTTYAKLIQKVECSIALLKERRSALITAAVTGQIDLREKAA